jgi:SAM-dependent methyltransferase
MSENDQFWDFYWEVRLRDIEDLGKREAILSTSKLIRQLSDTPGQPVRMLELGCGEGQIIGPLFQAHAQVRSIDTSVGVDYKSQSLGVCRHNYPALHFVEGDFTNAQLLERLGQFEIVLLVNALHEVFSATYSDALGEVDIPAAKERAERALYGAIACIKTSGYLVLFDGLETSGDPQQKLLIRFHTLKAKDDFLTFVNEYRPFRITYGLVGDAFTVELSWRDFTRYITKSIFLGKPLWQSERLESYQYFNEDEFRRALTRAGLLIRELRTLTVDYEKWHNLVEIITPGYDFPAEHILILAQKIRL